MTGRVRRSSSTSRNRVRDRLNCLWSLDRFMLYPIGNERRQPLSIAGGENTTSMTKLETLTARLRPLVVVGHTAVQLERPGAQAHEQAQRGDRQGDGSAKLQQVLLPADEHGPP